MKGGRWAAGKEGSMKCEMGEVIGSGLKKRKGESQNACLFPSSRN